MSIFALLRRLERITRPAPSLAHDYDLPVQDVDDEVWAPFTPDGRCIFCGKTRDYIAMSDGDGASVCLGPLCPNTSGPSPVTTRTSAGDSSAAAGILPPTAAAEPLTWLGWAVPAILDVLATHQPRERRSTGDVHCLHGDSELVCHDYGDWSEHVADLIAERIACDTARAIAALQNFQPK